MFNQLWADFRVFALVWVAVKEPEESSSAQCFRTLIPKNTIKGMVLGFGARVLKSGLLLRGPLKGLFGSMGG